jgi:hypothetical protein
MGTTASSRWPLALLALKIGLGTATAGWAKAASGWLDHPPRPLVHRARQLVGGPAWVILERLGLSPIAWRRWTSARS